MAGIKKEIAVCQKCGKTAPCYIDDIQHYNISFSKQLVDSPNTTAVVKHGLQTVSTYRNKAWATVPVKTKDGKEHHVCLCEECVGVHPVTSLKNRNQCLVLFMILTAVAIAILVQGIASRNTSIIVFGIICIVVKYIVIAVCSAMLLKTTNFYMPSVLLSIIGYGYIVMFIALFKQKSIRQAENELLFKKHINDVLFEFSKQQKS